MPHRLRTLITCTFCVSAALGACATATGAPPPPVPSAALPAMADFRDIVQRATGAVFPAVVYIRVNAESFARGARTMVESSGSGVILSTDGEIVTNWHVIDKAVTVRCLLSDGRAYEADIVGADQSTDLALLRLRLPAEAPPVPTAAFGDSSRLAEGDFVMAMGAPWGLNRSVSIGIVSCTRRFLPAASEYSLWLQTDAAINPGNSGGPLVDTDGRIIGVNARGMTAGDGVGFAIPATTVQELLPLLREHGRVPWSWTGLRLQPLRDFDRGVEFPGTHGVIVTETEPMSPARAAGFEARDRIVRVNGEPVSALTAEDLPDLHRALALIPHGHMVTLAVERGHSVIEIDLAPVEKGRVQGEELDLARFDLSVKAINRFENEELFFHRPVGVFVFGLRSPGNAASAGLRRNDILLRIGDTEIETLDDVRAAHAAAMEHGGRRSRVVVVVLRGGLERQFVLDYARDWTRQ
ncbi:MAG: trypsin-like peptidase domain-containing protein [Phycisphaeraceae bacterium]|nr:trypsin-like peptidase domain-containing protein [Phycisphaeraceae bacterium]